MDFLMNRKDCWGIMGTKKKTGFKMRLLTDISLKGKRKLTADEVRERNQLKKLKEEIVPHKTELSQ